MNEGSNFPRGRRYRLSGRRSSVNITVSEKALERVVRRVLKDSGRPDEPKFLRPTLRPWIEVIDEIVKSESELPKRLQTTAMRILHVLREKHGYKGGYSVVQEYVQQLRNPEAAEKYRKSRNKPSHKDTGEPLKGVAPAQTISSSLEETSEVQQQGPTGVQPPTVQFRRTLRSPVRPKAEPLDIAFAWMRSLQQGSVPLESLSSELSGTPAIELEILQGAAVRGKLPQRNRAVAIMSYIRGISTDHISHFLQISNRTVYGYWKIYREGGATKLLTRKQRKDKLANDDFVREAVFAVLHAPPSSYGFNRTSWAMADLVEAVSTKGRHVGAPTIRVLLKESGFRWKHARVVLTSSDPEDREKVAAIKALLAQLTVDEAFFSRDEYGPFAIKMKGGKKRVAPGEQYVVPQWQRSQGWTILTAALELSRNQVTHFYSRKKNTAEMIRMADRLREQYRSYRTLYLSWDAASWHVSKDLLAYLGRVNRNAVSEGYPVVKTMPLPAGSQFLNVIESVFSGMARTVIHNSDYPSVEAAQQANNLYFETRNRDYLEKPQRAGKKIWGLERVPSIFSEGNNCKDPMYDTWPSD